MQMDDGLKGTIFIRAKDSRPHPFEQISKNLGTVQLLKKAANNALLFNTSVPRFSIHICGTNAPVLSYDYKHYMSDWWLSEWKRTGVEQLCVDNILSELAYSSWDIGTDSVTGN